MPPPTLSDLVPTFPLATWLRYYCRLGYEVALSCRGPEDPTPLCQHLAARRQALRAAAQQQLRLHYGLQEVQAQHLSTQWSHDLFAHLLQQDAMRQLDLEVALNEPLAM